VCLWKRGRVCVEPDKGFFPPSGLPDLTSSLSTGSSRSSSPSGIKPSDQEEGRRAEEAVGMGGGSGEAVRVLSRKGRREMGGRWQLRGKTRPTYEEAVFCIHVAIVIADLQGSLLDEWV
jgi:hypothetical protein